MLNHKTQAVNGTPLHRQSVRFSLYISIMQSILLAQVLAQLLAQLLAVVFAVHKLVFGRRSGGNAMQCDVMQGIS